MYNNWRKRAIRLQKGDSTAMMDDFTLEESSVENFPQTTSIKAGLINQLAVFLDTHRNETMMILLAALQKMAHEPL